MRLSLALSLYGSLIVGVLAAGRAEAACPGVFSGAACNGGSGGNVCGVSGAQIVCDLGVAADTNGSNAKFVTNGTDFEGYGYEGDGEAFCCIIAQGVNTTFKATGTYQVDTILLYDNQRGLDLDCNYHEVYSEDEDDTIGGSRLTGPTELLDGDNDDDTIHGNAGSETIVGDLGYDALYGEAGDDTIDCGGNDDQAWGGDGADTITGGGGADVLHGDDGADTLSGDGGDDDVYGDDGDDTLYGGDDSDLLCGGNDADALYGEDGDDFVHGQWGTDNPNHGGNDTDKCEFENPVSCFNYYSSMICVR